MYGYTCEYCDGVVKEKLVKRKYLSTKLVLLCLKTYLLVFAINVVIAIIILRYCRESKKLPMGNGFLKGQKSFQLLS